MPNCARKNWSILTWIITLSFVIEILAPSFALARGVSTQAKTIQPLTPHFRACQGMTLLSEKDWNQNQPRVEGCPVIAKVPDQIGNFDSIAEALKLFSGETRDFLELLTKSVEQLAEAQRDYAKTMADCLRKGTSESEPLCRETIAKDRAAIQKNWHDMRMGLALGFNGGNCFKDCDSFSRNLKHPFDWSPRLAKPSEFGAKAFQQDKIGALTQEEAKEAEKEVTKVLGNIDAELDSNRYMSLIDQMGNETLNRKVVKSMRLSLSSKEEASLRERWKLKYFSAISKAPLLLLISKPNASNQELAKAYEQVAGTAGDLLRELRKKDTMQAWDYLNLSARDKLLGYRSLIETLLSDPKNKRFCGIAERLYLDKSDNDDFKMAASLSAALGTGIGCVFTAASYAGLGLCSVAGISLSAKSWADTKERLEDARLRTLSSATPSLLVDSYERLSEAERDAVIERWLLPLGALDIGIGVALTAKLSKRSLDFLKQLRLMKAQFSGVEASGAKTIDAIQVLLRESSDLKVAKRASELLERLPLEAWKKHDPADLARAVKAVAELTDADEAVVWIARLTAITKQDKSSVRGFSAILDRAQTLKAGLKLETDDALKRALSEQAARVHVIDGKLTTLERRRALQRSMARCLGL